MELGRGANLSMATDYPPVAGTDSYGNTWKQGQAASYPQKSWQDMTEDERKKSMNVWQQQSGYKPPDPAKMPAVVTAGGYTDMTPGEQRAMRNQWEQQSGWQPPFDPADPPPVMGAAWSEMSPTEQQAMTAWQQRQQEKAFRTTPNRDVSTPGALEVGWNEHGDELFAPGATEAFNQQHGADYFGPTASGTLWNQQQARGPMTNYAEREYLGFDRPDIATEPGYGTYYDRAEQKAVNALTNQLSALGQYGSSAGLGQIGTSITDLRADQARTEAQYNLDRLAEQRGWDTLGGALARNADLSGQGNVDTLGRLASSADEARLKGLEGAQGAAEGADRMELGRLLGGFGVAGNVQGAEEGRVFGGFDRFSDLAAALARIVGGSYDKTLNEAEEGIYSTYAPELAGGQQALNNASQDRQGWSDFWSSVLGAGTAAAL